MSGLISLPCQEARCMPNGLRLLMIEDSEDDAFFVLRALRREWSGLIHHRVETLADLEIALDQQGWDLIISDYKLPGFNASRALEILQHRNLDLPFIVVSGSIGEETAVTLMKAGAHDYVMKDNLTRLIPAVKRELREAQERQQRRRAEQTIQENAAWFQALIENALDIIIVLTADGTIRYSSPSLQRVLGYDLEGMLEHDFFVHVHQEDQAEIKKAIAQALKQQNSLLSIEFRMRHQMGDWRVLEAIGQPLSELLDQPVLVLNARDVTERNQTEAIRKELKAERERRELRAYFFSKMSHELKNPLTGITVAVELLEKMGQQITSDRRQQYFQGIRTAVQQMVRLLEDSMTIGKAESGKLSFQPVALELEAFCAELVAEVQARLGQHHHLTFSYRGCSTVSCIDQELLRHILQNLLSNAIKYSPPGTEVQFSLVCGTLAEMPETLQTLMEQQYPSFGLSERVALFQIQDCGIGIPEADQQQLFNPFHRASNVGRVPGTGLGLSIVKDCVELHQGILTLDSAVGRGTTFTILLPLALNEAIAP